MIRRLVAAACLALVAGPALAKPGPAPAASAPLNVTAIVLFVVFVAITLGITYWASGRTRSAADYYAANGQITSLQNGFATRATLTTERK